MWNKRLGEKMENELLRASTGVVSNILMTVILIIVLIIVGIIVASVLKKLVLKLLEMEKLNNFFSKFDTEDLAVDSDLTFVNLIAELVYWIVLFCFLIPVFSLLGLDSISSAIGYVLAGFINFLPALIYAIIIVMIGLFVAKIVKKIVYIALYKARLNDLVKKMIFESRDEKSLDLSSIISVIVYILLLVVFITQALAILNLDVLTRVSGFVIGLIPAIIAAVAIFIGAYILGSFLEGLIVKTFNGDKFSKIVGTVVKYFIWIIGIGIVLNQLGLDIMLINATYIVLLITVGVALAISFGVGGIGTAKKIIEKNADKFIK